MAEVTNVDKLRNYLIGDDNPYLKDDKSNGKIIMLSGEWGSGKTHFWQHEIINELDNHIYISLYGKSSLEDIKDEVFTKAYYLSINRIGTKKDKIEQACFIFQNTKSTQKYIGGLSKLNDEKKLEKAEKFLENGVVICFDDFERKSKEVDLNDLFGFITHLSLIFNTKVVIILNADVFQGEDKKTFTTVKEKTVSKYLYFNPTCEELFEIISNDEKYDELQNYKEVILNTFKKVGIINARIFMQILDNVLEWVQKTDLKNDETIEILCLVNINFILNHNLVEISSIPRGTGVYVKIIKILNTNKEKYRKLLLLIFLNLERAKFENVVNTQDLISFINNSDESSSTKEAKIKDIEDNLSEIDAILFAKEYIGLREINVDINSFIQTGIL